MSFSTHTAVLDCRKQIIIINNDIKIALTPVQFLFLSVLMDGITEKKAIIEKVWGQVGDSRYDNNYYQIIFQIRHLLKKNNLTVDFLQTIHCHGVRLNYDALGVKQRKLFERFFALFRFSN
ncbi:DNA-binding winged helix-turn-helix (wHTH) protein [Pantoea agglomerans]|nr:DNA-binding winged helix-turn-helix (wHTH) protein [Pantoea agglomerans]